MRAYVGNQYQDNSLLAMGSFNPAAVNVASYCTLSANNAPVIFNVTPQPYNTQFTFVGTGFYVYANGNVTGGAIQPQIQLADGPYRDYGPLISPLGSGFIYAVTINSPILGAQFSITNPITGGALFLEIDVLLG